MGEGTRIHRPTEGLIREIDPGYAGSRFLVTAMLRLVVIAIAISACVASHLRAETVASHAQSEQQQSPSKTDEVLTEAVIIASLIAASVAAYKAMGRPCACPEDTMRNGRRCGGNSAWARAGGFKPLCYATDITGAMIDAYRTRKAVPALR